MALTNAQVKEILSKAGVAADAIDDATKRVVEGHVTSINALREERDSYKSDLEKANNSLKTLADVQKELDELKKKSTDDWKKKFDDEHLAFENYKANVASEKLKAEKRELYKKLLTDLNVESTRIDAILKVTDIEKFEVDEEGKFKDEDTLKKNAENEWSGFILSGSRKGADVGNPPANEGNGGSNEPSRAAKLAAEYHKNLYGSTKGD